MTTVNFNSKENQEVLNEVMSRIENQITVSSDFTPVSNVDELMTTLKDKKYVDMESAKLEKGDILCIDIQGYRDVKVGNSDSTAPMLLCKSILANGTVYVKQLYLSTLRKSINVYDEEGEQVLVNGAPSVVNGRGNSLWESAQACFDAASLLKLLLNEDGTGKVLKVVDVKRAYGPKFENRTIVGRRLTSLPLFQVFDTLEDACK